MLRHKGPVRSTVLTFEKGLSARPIRGPQLFLSGWSKLTGKPKAFVVVRNGRNALKAPADAPNGGNLGVSEFSGKASWLVERL